MAEENTQQEIEELLTQPAGPVKSYTELVAEIQAAGKAVPPGIAMLADAEQKGVL